MGTHGEAVRDFDFFDAPVDEFSNPVAADVPSTVPPATPKRKKKRRGFGKKERPSGPKETELAPADFEANPLADSSVNAASGNMDIETPQRQQQQPADTKAPPIPAGKKKRKKKQEGPELCRGGESYGHG